MSEPQTEARQALLVRLFEAFNRHDADGVMACFTPDIVFHAAAGPEANGRRLAGAEAVRAAFVATWTAMPDVSWQVRRHAVFGDRAVSEWLFRATAPDGGRIEAEGLDLFEFAGPLIAAKSAFRKDRPPIPPVQPAA
ncbi:nuclear transport factor 2 family protein [Roseomonas sp. NAR14]|uniref:Nuclear transport factor 2 family protein n=1 Tax=Roseomonas acroporae TaxID=2937791 RepID=A0A9X2BVV0_9PROT|nr:nuclear transport factor 2 family protein [Roseomonas acroporae]MCK8787018.1 nuclear transport factor 2 family protein [Roseomonas acroporae]